MSATIFGTDGVRGTPGQYPLDERTIVRLGAATVRAQEVDDVTLLVALDTRESGPWIETQLARGVTAQRGHLVSAGIIPTPAAAFLAAAQSFDAALVISASHNPFPDNGIKLLTDTGEKASPALEARVEAMITDESWTIAEQVLPAIEARDLSDTYVAHAAAVLAGLEVNRPGFSGGSISWEDGVDGKTNQILTGGAGACGTARCRPRTAARLAMGGDSLGGCEDRVLVGNLTPLGAAGRAGHGAPPRIDHGGAGTGQGAGT